MNNLVKDRLKTYGATPDLEKQGLREIIQEIALLGLWRGKFFEHAAFYGGTALRILYRLDRFSEDLDFTLTKPDKKFDLSSYLKAVQTELLAYGFATTVEKVAKTQKSAIESAFIKADTQIHLLHVGSKNRVSSGELLKVKLDVDTDPALGFRTNAEAFFWPQVFSVTTCDLPSLLAGKLHAAFCRKSVQNVKGRDWYDLLWYVARDSKPNYNYLESKLRQTGHWPDGKAFTPKAFLGWASEKVGQLDIEAAKRDVVRFLPDPRAIDGWSRDAFIAALRRFS
jgi:predicted nucleotidyltransferase component of viral defense system